MGLCSGSFLIKWMRVLSGIIRSPLIIISIPVVVGNTICVSKHIRLLSLSLKLDDYKAPVRFPQSSCGLSLLKKQHEVMPQSALGNNSQSRPNKAPAKYSTPPAHSVLYQSSDLYTWIAIG